MFLLRVLLIIIVPTLTVGYHLERDESKWNHFKTNYNKSYESKDEEYRKNIFFANLGRIKVHNERASLGMESYRLGVNKYADMEFTEFARKYLKYSSYTPKPSHLLHNRKSYKSRPKFVDWRDKKIVGPIKDQGDCGSCWAFSAVAALESAHASATGSFVSLSEQNLIDCSWNQGNEGCIGGVMEYAYDYILDSGGIDTESSYPYQDSDRPCRFNKTNIGAKIRNYVEIASGDEESLIDAVTTKVVSVALEAGLSFQLYSGGVYNNVRCTNRPSSLNHAVAIIGYGSSDDKQDYWIIKNSWGTDWGEKGFGRIVKGENHCGIALQASYPIV